MAAEKHDGADHFVMWLGWGMLAFGVLVLLILVTLVASCSSGSGDAARQSVQNDQIIFAGEDAVRARLRDPGSAEFSNVRVSRKSGVAAVCGYVNARNGFGGMAGRERFISGGVVGMESDFAPGEFAISWSQLC